MLRSPVLHALVAVLVLAAHPRPAAAQPAPPPDAAAPAPPPDAAAPAPVDPAPVDDPAPLRARFDAAFAALVAGDLAAAIPELEVVASQSASVETRAAAAALLRLARELIARDVVFVARGPAAPPAPPAPDVRTRRELRADRDSGRTTVIVSTTMVSTYSGVVLLDLLDVDDFRPAVLVIAGTTAVGFLGSLYGSRGRAIPAAVGDGYTLGLGLGVGNGLLLASPLGLDDSEEIESFALGAMAIGGAAGMWLTDRTQPIRARVNLAGTLAMLGLATTGLGLGVFQPDDLDTDDVLLIMTAGLDLGTTAGMALTPGIDWSLSRSRLVGLGAFLGGLAGWSAAALATGADVDDNTTRAWSVATLAGMWAGFGLGAYFTRKMAPDARFQVSAAPARGELLVTPTRIRDAPGFAVAGQF